MRRIRISAIAWLLLCGLVLGTNAQNRLIAEMDFEYAGGHIVVNASIKGGDPLRFVFDTGAGGVVMLEEELEQAGKLTVDQNIPVMGAGGETRMMKMSQNNPIRIGELDFSPAPVLLSSLQNFRDRGYDFDGILGSRQIEDYVMEIDYERRKLRFYDKSTFQYEGDGLVLPIQRPRGIPSVEATFTTADGEKIEGRALIDTGAALPGNVNTPTVKQHDLIDKSTKKLRYEALGATGRFETFVARMKRVDFSEFSFENVPMNLSTIEGGPLGDPNFIGVIGNHILRKFKITLDYAKNQMILEPNSKYNSVFPENVTGIRYTFVLTENQGLHIDNVFKNSPASDLGIKTDDEIVRVAGKNVDEYSRQELYDFMHHEGPAFEIVWLSNGTRKTGEIKPRKLI